MIYKNIKEGYYHIYKNAKVTKDAIESLKRNPMHIEKVKGKKKIN